MLALRAYPARPSQAQVMAEFLTSGPAWGSKLLSAIAAGQVESRRALNTNQIRKLLSSGDAGLRKRR